MKRSTRGSGPTMRPEDGLLLTAMSGSPSGLELDRALAELINTPNTTPYDQAIDAVYLAQHTGGSHLHHLIDGHHDIVNAFLTARDTQPHDGLANEVFGTAHHLSKDIFSVMGLPVVSLSPTDYQSGSTWIETHLGIPLAWQADLLQINGLELLGGSLAAAVTVMGIKQRDAGRLFEIAGAAGLGGVLAANPIAIISAAVALAAAWRCIKGSRPDGSKKRILVGAGASGAALATGHLLGGIAASGTLPLVLALAVSLTAGIVAQRWLSARLQSKTQLTAEHSCEAETIWHRHVIDMSKRIQTDMDRKALDILQTAFA